MSNSSVKSMFRRLEEFNGNPEGVKYREQGMRSILVAANLLAFLVISGMTMLDQFSETVYPNHLLLFRVLLGFVLLLNLLLALLLKKYKSFLYSPFYLLALYFTFSSYLTGEIENSSLTGLNILLIVWFCLVPLNYKSLIFHGSMFIIQYYLLLLVFGLHPVLGMQNLQATIFLLFTIPAGSVIAIFMNNNVAKRFGKTAASRKNEDHLTILSDNMQDILWEMDVQTRLFTYISPSCEKLTGFSPDEIIASPMEKFLTPESRERAEKLIMDAVTQIQSGNQNIIIPITDLEQYCKDGSTIHTEISATLISHSGKLEIVGVSRDITERRNAEKALVQSEGKFRKIVETSPVAMSFAYMDGRIGYLNERFIGKFGYTLSDIPDLDTYFKKVYPDEHYRQKVISDWDQYVEDARISGTPIEPYEVKMTCKDGSRRDIIILGALLGDSVLAIFNDITETKVAEEALKESQERYALAVEGVNDGIWDWNLNTDEVFFSRRYKAILGYEDSEFLNELDEWKKHIHPEDADRVIMANMDYINGNAPKLEVEYRILHKDGTYRWVLGRGICLRDEDGKAYRMAGSHIDITERKKAEEELRKANERLTFHFMQAPLGYIEWNENLEVIDWNPAAERIFGYTKEEAMNCHAFNIIVPPEIQSDVTSVWKSILDQTGGVFNLNVNVSKTGKRLICEWHNTPLKDKEGKVIAIASIVQDITERKRLEGELAKSLEILQKHYSQTLEKVQIYSEELQLKTNELLKLQKDNLQSQFETLKNQVNPHFLFNSLNVLASLIGVDPELAERFTGQLSKIYRYVLEHKSEDIVPLSTEMNFLESYVFLLNIRFKDKLKVNIMIPPEKLKMKIPPLAIQLLIENAIKHNTFSVKSPLVIDVHVDKEDYLNVINNYQKREKQIESTGLGLQNITDRIGYFTEKKPYFGVRGNNFVARIPLL